MLQIEIYGHNSNEKKLFTMKWVNKAIILRRNGRIDDQKFPTEE